MNTDSDEQTTHELAVSPSPSQGLRVARCNNMPPFSATASDQIPTRSEYRYQQQEDGSDGEASRDSLAYVQLEAYNVDAKSLYNLQESQKEYLSRIVRTQIFSKVKFLPKSGNEHEKVFGSFWKPNLLENTPGYIDAILDNYSDLKLRTKKDVFQLTGAVHLWLSASSLVQQVILDRRSNVTQRMKRELVVGK
jgi:hypothetical protein